LLEQGFFYPNYDIIGCDGHYAHIGMANALASDHPKYSRQNAEDFFRKVEDLSRNYTTTLISAESLYRQTSGNKSHRQRRNYSEYWESRDRYIADFRTLIGPAEIAVVLRRQDEFAESLYQEHVKVTRYTRSFSSFLEQFWFHFCYLEQVAAWSRYFDTVRIIPFNRIKGPNIAQRLISEFGSSFPELADAPMRNVSMPHDGVLLKREFNGDAIGNSRLDDLTDILLSEYFREQVNPGRRSFFDDHGHHKAFLSQYADNNAALARANNMEPQALFDADVPDGLNYGDNLTTEERARLLAVVSGALPDLTTELDQSQSGTGSVGAEYLTESSSVPFERKLPEYQLDYRPGGEILVVHIDRPWHKHRAPSDQNSWWQVFLADEGHSALHVMSRTLDRHGGARLSREFTRLRDNGFFSGFDRVVLTGNSIAGGMAAFLGSLLPGSLVICFSPQGSWSDPGVQNQEGYRETTLREDNEITATASGTKATSRTYVFFDPFSRPDQTKALSSTGKETVLLRAPLLGNNLQDAHQELDLLKEIVRRGIAGTLSGEWYYAAIRQRRTLARYYRNIAGPLARRGRTSVGQKLMRRATDLFQDAHFRYNEAVFMAADGKLEAALQAIDHTLREGRKKRKDRNS
jgi:hypothetical protein